MSAPTIAPTTMTSTATGASGLLTMPAPGRKTIYLASHDKLLWNYDGAIGIKNGYTVKARATFVGAATRNGHTLIVTLMSTTKDSALPPTSGMLTLTSPRIR